MYTTARSNGYENNKEVKFSKIEGIDIENFRSIRDRKVILGDAITLISGKNGTMKSSILGLLAHPFSSPNGAKDIYNHPLKTSMKDVFRLSLEKDEGKYKYYILAKTTTDKFIREPVEVYKRESRHRVTVGEDHSSGLGNFSLNTSYVNFRRLFPLILTGAKEKEIDSKIFSETDKRFISDAYNKILQKDSYKKIKPVSDDKNKDTFGPSDSYYDYSAISSGEDNLGNILIKMLAFQKYKTGSGGLEGIFCVDEIEASLHPIAQEKLFNFMLNWANKNSVQVVATTHSLYLIQHAIQKQKELNNKEMISINMISTAFVDDNNYNIIHNPSYDQAYKELTFKTLEDLQLEYKIKVILEDEIAKYYFSRIFFRSDIKKYIDIYCNLVPGSKGNSSSALNSLVKNGGKLLEDCIVLYDTDIDISVIKKKGVVFSKLPDPHSLPVEKAIAYYIHNLNGGNKFFTDIGKEKMKFESEFADHDIDFPDTIDELRELNIGKFKKWAKSQGKVFNKYINHYVLHNQDYFEEFKCEFKSMVNSKLSLKSLPSV